MSDRELLRDCLAFLRSSVRLNDDREHTPWFDGLKHMVLVVEAALRSAPIGLIEGEREECARMAETYRKLWGSTVEGSQDPGPTIAAAIRARGSRE